MISLHNRSIIVLEGKTKPQLKINFQKGEWKMQVLQIEMNTADRNIVSKLLEKELERIKNFKDNPKDPIWENYRNHIKEILKKVN